MSFILDALRKSETERQQQGSGEFAGVPVSTRRRQGPPGWLWTVAVLLLVNLAVLAGILMRSEVAVDEPVSGPVSEPVADQVAGPAAPAAAANGDDFAAQVATARRNAPVRAADPPADEPVMASTLPAPVTASPPRDTATLPTLMELQAGGRVALPELHVDIHVYSEASADRFVFINMVKHKEGSRLPEGPLVEQITPDGVILEHDGTSFLLPRD
jgi:general secretion pathway protein B